MYLSTLKVRVSKNLKIMYLQVKGCSVMSINNGIITLFFLQCNKEKNLSFQTAQCKYLFITRVMKNKKNILMICMIVKRT